MENILLFIGEKIFAQGRRTTSGTLLSILPNLFSVAILKTFVLAALGATVSFTVSLLLKWLLKFKNK
jgi:hypothetical protein